MSACVILRRKGEVSRFQLRPGLGIQALCAKVETGIEFDCREADCGICVVKVIAGAAHLSPQTPKESDFLQAMKADADERLACQVRVLGDVELEIDYL